MALCAANFFTAAGAWLPGARTPALTAALGHG